jgi:hypothetical protein
MHVADVDARVEVLERLVALAERLGQSDFVALGREWSIYARLERGELPRARVEHERFAAVAAVLRQPRFDHAALAWRAVFDQLDGRLDEAERLAHEGRRYAGRVHVADADALFASQLCFIRRDQDRLGELLPAVRPNAAEAGDLSWRAGLVVALAGAGDRAGARAVLESAGGAGFEDVPRDFWWLARIALYAEGCALAGAARQAPALARLLEPYAERHVQLVFAAHLGSVHRFLGLLAAVRGDVPAAVEHLQAAWTRHRAGGAPALALRSACELAGGLLRTGGAGDRRRAHGLLREAGAQAAGSALAPLVARLAHDARAGDQARGPWPAAATVPHVR